MTPCDWNTLKELLVLGSKLEIICLAAPSTNKIQGEWRMNAVLPDGTKRTLHHANGVKEATACSPVTLTNRAKKLGLVQISIPLEAGLSSFAEAVSGSTTVSEGSAK